MKELFKGFDYKKYWADWKKIQVNQKKKTGKNQSDEKYFNFALRHLEGGEVLARL